MNFNQAEEEYIDGEDTVGLGTLGKEGSGRSVDNATSTTIATAYTRCMCVGSFMMSNVCHSFSLTTNVCVCLFYPVLAAQHYCGCNLSHASIALSCKAPFWCTYHALYAGHHALGAYHNYLNTTVQYVLCHLLIISNPAVEHITQACSPLLLEHRSANVLQCRLRIQAQQQKQKLTAKSQKKFGKRLYGSASGAATSGLSSSLAFTPVQVS